MLRGPDRLLSAGGADELRAGQEPLLAAVSHRVGYPDVSYLIRRFRAGRQVTSAQWRAAR